MVWKMVRNIMVLLFVLLGFLLLLLLPRDFSYVFDNGQVIIADSLFDIQHYKNNITDFFRFLKEEGFGVLPSGETVSDNSVRFFIRSIRIVIPSFIVSFFVGIMIGSAQFRFRNHFTGKILAFFNWVFSSIPDFFLYIALQYLLIKLYVAGLLPDFNLYGEEDWYSSLFPAFCLAIFPVIHLAKFISTSLLQESKKDYVRTSLAKGMNGFKVWLHMLRNCSAALIHQIQMVMLYILSSLPIFEKITNYHGAGYQLVKSILGDEDSRAVALMLPFLFMMIGVIALAQFIKFKLHPVNRGES